MLFLLEFDRQDSKLRQVIPFSESDREEAVRRLGELERSQLVEFRRMLRTGQRPRMEYVLLGAESEAVLRVTHPNYFESLSELSARLTSNRSNANSIGMHREAAITA